MKKILFVAVMLLIAAAGFAQEPTTTWPYLYPEFRQGTIYMNDGTTLVEQLNVHLRKGRLHFIDKKDIVREAVVPDVKLVKIGEDTFAQVKGEMMKVVLATEHGFVVVETLGDFASLQETGGAYGTSSTTSATRRLSSLDTDAQINQNHMLLLQYRSGGKMLPTVSKYFLSGPDFQVQASRREVESILPEGRQAEWKAWLKANKVKWNKPESLAAVVEFLCK